MIAPVSVCVSGASLSVVTPTGWTSLGFFTNSDVYEVCFQKVADAADVAASTFTFTCTGTGTAQVMQAGIAAWSLENTSAPVDQSITTSNSTTTTGITPTIAMGQFIMVFSAYNASGTSGSIASYAIANNNPAWTEVFDTGTSNGSKFFGIAIAYANSTRLAATGTASATLTGYSDSKIYLLNLVPPATPSLVASPVLPSPSLRAVVSPFSALLTMSVPTVSAVAAKWRNLAKSAAATFANLPKS